MPKLLCPCGYTHDLSPIPDDGWITIRDRDYEMCVSAEVELHKHSANDPDDKKYNELMATIINNQGLLYLCPNCHRIMWRRENSEKYDIYAPEKSDK